LRLNRKFFKTEASKCVLRSQKWLERRKKERPKRASEMTVNPDHFPLFLLHDEQFVFRKGVATSQCVRHHSVMLLRDLVFKHGACFQ
jgi:hypothetical protein